MKCINGPKREQLGNAKTWKLRQETNGFVILLDHVPCPPSDRGTNVKGWLQLNYPLGTLRRRH